MTIARRRRGPGHKRPILRDFCCSRRGAAFAEFSLVFPVALVLFTGTITYSNAIYIDRKVTLTARTVTDLVTQYTTPSVADIQTALSASSAIIAPYSAANIGVTVSEVTTDSSGKATIFWSQPLNANSTVRTPGQTVSLPAAIDIPNMNYIWGEVTYTFTPAVGYQVTGAMTLSDQTYMAPRLVAQIPQPTP